MNYGSNPRGGGVMGITRDLSHLPPPRVTCAGEACLDTVVTCPCGKGVKAGDGHDCTTSPWGGFWLCRCGHCTRHHNDWWGDLNGNCGMGCSACDDCDNPMPEGEVA